MLAIKPSKPFEKSLKKLVKSNRHLLPLLTDAIHSIRVQPYIGDAKTGDLRGIRCVDIYYQRTNYELAYSLEEDEDGNPIIVLLLLVGTRENFYKELKRFL